jgi:hypothetical protein
MSNRAIVERSNVILLKNQDYLECLKLNPNRHAEFKATREQQQQKA